MSSRSTQILGIIRGTHTAVPNAIAKKPLFVSGDPHLPVPRGTLPMHVEGGGRYWTTPGDVNTEKSYFVGGYFGPRYEIDESQLEAAFQVYEPHAHYNFNIEHWKWDSQWDDVADVNETARRFVNCINKFRRVRPDMKFSVYGLPFNAAFTARSPIRMPIAGWRRANDLMRPVLDVCDIVTPSLYSLESNNTDEKSAQFINRYIDMTIEESRRVANGKPVVPFIMARHHDSFGGGLINIDQFRTDVRRIAQIADGMILWSYNWPTGGQELYLKIAQQELK